MHAPAQSGPLEFAVNYWPAPIVEPTTLIAYWPAAAPPARNAIIQLFQSLGVPIDSGAAAPSQPHFHWHIGLNVRSSRPVHVWCEANHDQTRVGDKSLDACPWIIGLQSILDSRDPAGSYDDLIQLLLRAAPDAPAIFDANTGLCHDRDSIVRLAIDDAPPATEGLWRVDAIAAPATTNKTIPPSPVWLRTVGLHRCARPELELIDVPNDRADAGVTLLHILADHFIDQSPPMPGTPFEIGPNMYLSLAPIAEFLQSEDPRAFGALHDRQSLGIPPGAPAALIVDAGHDSAHPWKCPADVLQRIADGSAPLLLSTRATARQAALARRHWPAALKIYDSQRRQPAESPPRFFIKAALDASATGDSDREHLWFEILSIENGRARARPLHPAAAAAGIHADDEFAVDPAGITDWRIETEAGPLGPNNILPESTIAAAGHNARRKPSP